MEMSSEPSTSSHIEGIPEEILLNVLKNLTSVELLQARLISQRFKRVYKSNAHRLARPKIDQITFCVRKTTKDYQLGRFRMPETTTLKSKKKLSILLKKRSKKNSPKSLMHTVRSLEYDSDNSFKFFQALQNTIKKFSVRESICFDGCCLTSKIIEEFTQPYSNISSVQSLSFVLCDMHGVTAKNLIELVSRTSCTNFSMEFCKNSELCINDKLFAQIQELNTLHLQIRDYSQIIDLTDETLLRWAAQKQLPHTIEMREIRTGFTLLGVLALIIELKSRHDTNQIHQPVAWDLGSIAVNVANLMQFLTLQDLFFNIQNITVNTMRVFIDLSQQAPFLIINQDQNLLGLNAVVFPRYSQTPCQITFQLAMTTKNIAVSNEDSPEKHDEPMSFFEFIRTVHKSPCDVGAKCEQCNLQKQSGEQSQMRRNGSKSKLFNGIEKSEKKSDSSRDISVERKNSEGSGPTKIIPPMLRKVAYKNRRQETFHSLQMHFDRQVVPQTASSSGGNSPIADSHREDFLMMPSVESLRISETNGGRPYQKVQSDPSLLSKKTKSDVKLKKKRILHTIEQPDGSTVGYCTEELVHEHEAEN